MVSLRIIDTKTREDVELDELTLEGRHQVVVEARQLIEQLEELDYQEPE